MQPLLVLDDDPTALKGISEILSPHYDIHTFNTLETAENFLERRTVPVAILDLHLPEKSGLEIMREWKLRFPEMETVFCTAESRAESAVACLHSGAIDYLVKPFSKASLVESLKRAFEKKGLSVDQALQGKAELIGKSAAIASIRKNIQLLKGQTHLNVLILGESGTGKEIVARILHEQENPKRPFTAVNMAALPPALVESELFGVERGAYTDAKSSRAGKFELAHGGDLFLDEIADLAPELQVKLLRVLQERKIERLGSHQTRNITFRVLSATHQPISQRIGDGLFRLDLYYRIADLILTVPPLRERKEDIPLLVEYFIRKYSSHRARRFSKTALAALTAHDWPGNIRELESTVKRTLALTQDETVHKIQLLTLPEKKSQEPAALNGKLSSYEKNILRNTLKKHAGDALAAMRELGLSRTTFYRKLARFGLSRHTAS